MNEMLTLDEIQSRYDSEWVLVEDPELTRDLEVVRGKVVWHSRDRDEVYQKAIELRPKHAAFLYTGEMPEDMEYFLSLRCRLPLQSTACSAWISCAAAA